MGWHEVTNPNAYFEPDGTLVIKNDGTTWDDLRVPLETTKLGGNDPSFAVFKQDTAGTSRGVFLYWFSKSAVNEVFFSVQLPHRWIGTGTLEPHVHWVPKTDGAEGATVEWGLEYSWQKINEVFPVMSTIYTKTIVSTDTAYVAGKHYLSDFEGISLADPSVSSMLVCRFFRNAADETDDTYDDVAGVLEFDFHYEINSLGSRTEYVK